MSPAERLAASAHRGNTFTMVPNVLTLPGDLPGDDTVVIEVPESRPPVLQPGGMTRPWSFQVLWQIDGQNFRVEFPPGQHRCPRDLSEHWYLSANGVEIQGHPQTAAERLAVYLAGRR